MQEQHLEPRPDSGALAKCCAACLLAGAEGTALVQRPVLFGAMAEAASERHPAVADSVSMSLDSIGSTSSSLLDRVRAQDQDGWRRIARLYGPLVLYWCRGAGVPGDDRADVFQEVFRAVARHVGDFHRERSGSFRAWLRSIVRSRVADHFARRAGGQSAVGGTDAHRRLLEIPAEQEMSASASLAPDEETLVLRQALAMVEPEFEPKTWQAALRTIIDGRTATEVAEELGMTPAAIRKAKSRVLQRLRAEMEGLLE
jgi:RNA polymerase sigma-70 factor (ECF subfamily)